MKIIGHVGENYIAEVSHHELEKSLDKYFGKLKDLAVGQELDLGDGYDFRDDIRQLCRLMIEASEKFGRAQDSLLRFAKLICEHNEHPSSSGSNVEKRK